MIGIYKITSPTGKVYIGQSVNIQKRLSIYKNLHCKLQPKIYNSLLKHGVGSHKFEIIEECGISELNNKERHYQDLFNCIVNGLNCTATKSNTKSGRISDEHKKKISNHMTGKLMSNESKAKLSKSKKGIITRSRSKIILDFNTGVFYNSLTDLSISLKTDRITIYDHLVGKTKINKFKQYKYV